MNRDESQRRTFRDIYRYGREFGAGRLNSALVAFIVCFQPADVDIDPEDVDDEELINEVFAL